MHTKDKLAQALREANLPEMAEKAAEGWYHDYLSPLDMPEMELLADLEEVGTKEALALRDRHMNGDFDASSEESDAWAASPDGQNTMKTLMKDFNEVFSKKG